MKSLILRPTRLGFYLIGLNFILFILSVGYSNNLLFLFFLMLLAQTLFWYVETLGFSHPEIKNLKISSHFLGEETLCSFSANILESTEITLVINRKKIKTKGVSSLAQTKNISLMMKKRGKFKLESISFYDSAPFSLFAKKIEKQPDYLFFVYPALNQSSPLVLQGLGATEQLAPGSQVKGEEDFLGLYPYQGEESKKINWKYYARSGELYIKEGLKPELPYLNFVVQTPASEESLSIIASQLVIANRSEYAFSLVIDSELINLGFGQSHLENCLERLSEC